MKNTIEITEYSKYAPVSEYLKLVFLSDLHDYPNEPILDKISKINPDAVLVGGDFIHNHEKRDRGYEFLRAASSFAPTFCTVGNHERCYESKLALSVERTGAILLDNASALLKGIHIGGLTSTTGSLYPESCPPNTEWLEKFSGLDGYKILVSHHPEYYEKYIKQLPIDLILSGHAHGGQWRFFGKGVYAPGQGWFPKYTCGLYDERLIVSRGIGNQFRVPRINNKPEIVLLNLKAKNGNDISKIP